jgi:hypothetical protein
MNIKKSIYEMLVFRLLSEIKQNSQALRDRRRELKFLEIEIRALKQKRSELHRVKQQMEIKS